MNSKIFQKIEESGISKKSKILCAVSGGIDSVVMLNVLNDYKFDCIVAHCNFKLRGDESDRDENFVRKLADKFEFKFLCETFDTVSYAEELGISIQMAARDLRYEWFHKMAEKYNCDYIALAHNSDDQAETVITNLIRGTGIRGLTGMQFVKEKLFRPLIEVSREEIENFADKNTIDFCTDSTNATTKYSRNKIRHCIFPLMEEINISYKKNILRSVGYLNDTYEILQSYVQEAKKECVSHNDNKIFIDIEQLRKFVAVETVLFEILVGEGIPKNLAIEAISLLNSQTGKSVKFLNIEILKNRNNIVVCKESKYNMPEEVEIFSNDMEKLKNFNVIAQMVEYSENLEIKKTENMAYLDYDKLKFPLIVRKWKDGDKFFPFGMNNMKKLSDFFNDKKLSIFEKSEVLILTSGTNIVWVIGLRIDNRYKISSNTKNVLVMEFSK
jgi:tRNA(Ile)-lysidine synthase